MAVNVISKAKVLLFVISQCSFTGRTTRSYLFQSARFLHRIMNKLRGMT
jgi:hypothetical protein